MKDKINKKNYKKKIVMVKGEIEKKKAKKKKNTKHNSKEYCCMGVTRVI